MHHNRRVSGGGEGISAKGSASNGRRDSTQARRETDNSTNRQAQTGTQVQTHRYTDTQTHRHPHTPPAPGGEAVWGPGTATTISQEEAGARMRTRKSTRRSIRRARVRLPLFDRRGSCALWGPFEWPLLRPSPSGRPPSVQLFVTSSGGPWGTSSLGQRDIQLDMRAGFSSEGCSTGGIALDKVGPDS